MKYGNIRQFKMAASFRSKEIITFQVGNYSNEVGAHFWNLQEKNFKGDSFYNEIRHDMLHRNSLNYGNGQVNYTPRVISFDLKDNISRLADENAAKMSEESIAWDGAVDTYCNENIFTEKPGQENGVVACKGYSWLDFIHPTFHEKSLVTVENLSNEYYRSFDAFAVGENLFSSLKFRNEVEDKIHYFAEECDQLQGFQIFSHVNDGFGGLTSCLMQELCDDFEKKNCLCFSLMPAIINDETRQGKDQAMLNTLLSLAKFIDNGSHVVPLMMRDSLEYSYKSREFSYLHYKANNFDTSAILASAIDTSTLAYRLSHSQSDMHMLLHHLSCGGRKVSSLSLALPIPLSSTTPFVDIFQKKELVTPLTPDISSDHNYLCKSTVVRGIPSHLLKSEESSLLVKKMSAITQYQSSLGHYCPSYVAQTPCFTSDPFPKIFKSMVTQVGCVIEDYIRPSQTNVERISVLANLVNTEDIAKPLNVLLKGTDKPKVKRYPQYFEGSVEETDIESYRENINSLIQNYNSLYNI
ncbi:protein misato homolog 1-like isoform X1 [Xenia sp. Carnegie-2017]|uniref:protein misato homolog 1-like isoform X1 n=1 Tax=Xenia sp. Carnegie-2017 TaxID=2897299 RepID=UPI001F04672B|nr:protein misato homolog 1-like isoform X1 [Xenia sp. Carnegie-2017]